MGWHLSARFGSASFGLASACSSALALDVGRCFYAQRRMRTKLVEVQAAGSGNWGVFQLWQFEPREIGQISAIHPTATVWGALRPPTPDELVIWDLRTREGAMFDLTAELVPQLYRHQIHVCVLFEPFLVYLQNFVRGASFEALPAVVTLGTAEAPPTELLGWRHGEWIKTLPEEAVTYLQALQTHTTLPPLPRSLALLLKKLFPTISPQVPGDDLEAQILRGLGANRTALGSQLRERLGGRRG